MENKTYVFTGAYSEPNEAGVHVFQLDEQTGELAQVASYTGLKNPTFLNVNPTTSLVYALGEIVDEQGQKAAEIATLRFDAEQKSLTLVNRVHGTAGTTCHIQRDPSDAYLLTVSYHGGMVGLSAIEDNGNAGTLLDVSQHVGASAHHKNQDRPHPHSTFFSPDGKYAYVQDLGLDQIIVYTINPTLHKLERQHTIDVHPGGGPRHLVFHPQLPFAYVIHELDSTITQLAYDEQSGMLTPLAVTSTLPEGVDYNTNATAEIAISADGRFLYGSNRGHDSIAVFAVDAQTGALTAQQYVACEGGHPRHFALVPGGAWLLCANRDNDVVASFAVHPQNGQLTFTGHTATLSKPVCVVPVQL